MAGVWEAEEPGRSKESVDALGSVLCKNALNESLIVGVSVYHIERDFSGVGVSDPCNLDGDWGYADTVVTNDVSLAFLCSSLDHTTDEQSENRDTTSSS